MTEVKTILEMIESLAGYTEAEILRDHTDTLDEIDARVFFFKEYDGKVLFHKIDNGATFYYNPGDEENCYKYGNYYGTWVAPQYTRSRDALKAIRPEGGWWEINTYSAGAFCFCQMDAWRKEPWFKSPGVGKYLPTEELAELHAIVQAIEWERSQ